MGLEDVDTTLFIAAVESRPEVWNVNCSRYKDRKWKRDGWNSIARAVFDDYDSMSPKEKYAAVRAIMCKWRNLRDAYARDLRISELTTVTTGGTRKRRRYVFADNMRFLDDILRMRRCQEREIDSSEDTNHPFSENQPQQHSPLLITKIEPETDEPEMVNVTLVDDPFKEDIPEPVNKAKVDVPRNSSNDDEMDEDKAFFCSVLPSVRSLTDDEKLQFRIEVLSLIRRIKNKQSGSTYNGS